MGSTPSEEPVGDPRPRRVFLWLLVPVAACLVVVALIAGATTIFVGGTCGCAATPTPYAGGPSPTLPVSPDQAEADAQRFTGLPMVASGWPQTAGDPLYELTAAGSAGTYAFVDAETDNVLVVFTTANMADAGAVTVTPDAARAAAAEYLDAAGVDLMGSASSVRLEHQGASSYYEVGWAEENGNVRWDAFVNASSGVVFAVTDLGYAPKNGLAVPVIGAATAKALAMASTYSGGEQASGAPDFVLEADPSGRPVFHWLVGFNDGVLGVDAVSGDVSVEKWARS